MHTPISHDIQLDADDLFIIPVKPWISKVSYEYKMGDHNNTLNPQHKVSMYGQMIEARGDIQNMLFYQSDASKKG